MTEMPVISADSHVQEPPELYSQWLDAGFRDRAPRTETRDGKTYVIVDGRKPRRIDLADARASDDDQNREFRNDPTGGRDVDRRLHHGLDRRGLQPGRFLPGKGEEGLDDLRAALGRVADLLDPVFKRRVFELVAQHHGVTDDDRKPPHDMRGR